MMLLKSLAFGFLFLFSNLNYASCPPPEELVTVFDEQLDSVVSEFSVTGGDELSAQFFGGMRRVPKIGQFDSVDYAWIVLPEGETIEGASNGSATIVLAPPGDSMVLDVQTGVDVFGRVQIIDTHDTIIAEHMLSSALVTSLQTLVVDGEAKIAKVKVIVDGGSEEVAVLGFTYLLNSSCNDSAGLEVGAINPFFLLLARIFGARIFLRKRLSI